MKAPKTIARIAAALPLLGAAVLPVVLPARPAIAQGVGLEPAQTSRLIALSLPEGAYRSTSDGDNAKFADALGNLAQQNNGHIGKVEVLIWQGGGAKQAMPGLLKKAGYTYAPQGSLNTEAGSMTLFNAVGGARKNTLLGMWVEQKEAVLLAWGPFTANAADAAPATEKKDDSLSAVLKRAGAAAGENAAPVRRPAAADSAGGDAITLQLDGSVQVVNVMKNAMPKLPAFPKLAPKPGHVRGYVYDANGKPLQGALLGVRSTSAGGFYSGNQGKTDAKGYYEIAAPWGVGHFYCAGYAVDYGEGRAALGLHPADGELDGFASNVGAVENFVLVPYGIADRDAVQDDPRYANNYHGGNIILGWRVGDDRPLFASPSDLPAGSVIEVTLTPDGPLIDGSRGRPIVIRKALGNLSFGQLYVNNIPVAAYTISAKLVGGGALKMKEIGPNGSKPFGLAPKEASGTAALLLRPGGAKPDSAVAAHGNWQQIVIDIAKQ